MAKGFSIEKYKKKQSATEEKSAYPHWLNQDNPMLVAFYENATDQFKDIKARINADKKLAPKERQIVKSAVARACEADKSNFRKGRPAEPVSDYIDKLNEDLRRIWAKRNPVKRKNPERLLRSELEIQNKELKKENRKLTTSSYREYFDRWIELYSTKESQRMRAYIIDLETKVKDLELENIKLESQLREAKRRSLRTVK